MSRAPDPRWIGLACRVYSACLWLYPGALRQAHGEEMLVAFRDRCREVAAGRVPAWRVFGMELFPDLLRSATGAQLELGVGPHQRRAFGGLIVLCVLAIALLTQSQWSGVTTQALASLKSNWLMMREAREYARHRDAVVSFAAKLASRPEPESRALAAFLHRTLYDQSALPYAFADERGARDMRVLNQGEQATALAAPLATPSSDAYVLSVAVRACDIHAGCNRGRAIQQLLIRDPDNAFGWMLAFKWASLRADEQGMALAVEKLGGARYFESHNGRIQHDLLAAAQQLAPGDTDLLADIANEAFLVRQVDTEDFRHDLRLQCSASGPSQAANPRWIDRHPESQPACLHFARLLTGSTDLFSKLWGWQLLQRAGAISDEAQRAARSDAFWLFDQELSGFGVIRGEGRTWSKWTDQDWQRWAGSWQAGDGEVPAVRRWLKARGVPQHAPADLVVPAG